MTSLKSRAFSATAWSGADIVLRQGLQFAVSVALARLLSPEEFGTIALLYLFTGIATAFVDSGFSAALIQRQDVTRVDESTVFWFNLLMGGFVALMLVLAAPWIAAFYAIPAIEPLAWAMAANVFLSALGAIHGTLLTKRLDFRTQMKVGVVASLVSGGVAVWMAAAGYGVWALAMQVLLASLLTTVLLWVMNPWRPQWAFSSESARKLFGFGGYLMASGLLDVIYSRLYTLLIGKMFGVRELGYYNRAESTKQLPVGMLAGILSRVALPIFAQASNDKAQLRRGVKLSVRALMLINVPAMFGLAAAAEPLVLTLFGERWLPMTPFLRVLCLAGVFWPLHVINLNVLVAQGHSALFFRLEVVKKLLGVLLILVGASHGAIGISWSMVAFSLIAVFINSHYTAKFLGYGVWSQVCDVWPALILSLVMAIVVFVVGEYWHSAPWIELSVLVMVGVATFASLAHLAKVEAWGEAFSLIQEILARRK